ncbi:MAG: mannose-6-phosphate isomerase [Flavobacteriales bacterium]|nr:MAG: mannose-6-phosphate isomerase [Flavobacteriales bacterium]
MKALYPIKFTPILQERIWGGDKLVEQFNKPSEKKNLGESWEISGVKGNISVVSNGILKGEHLTDLIKTYRGDLVGEKVYKKFGTDFPILIKFIDAKTDLSIQLHPNDKLAKKRHNSFGKTEMWYVMQADSNGKLIVGFNKEVSKEAYLKHVENKTLINILNVDKVSEGDVYFIPTGRIHAIGGGVMVAEIQQTSDITYRIYDWDRKDSQGNERELHTDLAVDALDYEIQSDYKTEYEKKLNQSSPVVNCKYFTTNIMAVNDKVKRNYSKVDSFVIYICVKGKVQITTTESSEELYIGETILIPAALKEVTIYADEYSELLEVYVG